jgi:ribosomal protein S18 acetylase RimI-like enzyme
MSEIRALEIVSPIRKLEITDRVVAEQVLEIQHVSYRIEAELIGFDALPPLLETWQDLAESGETFFGAFVGHDLAGAISYKLQDAVLDIHRVMVHPDYFRRGIAQKLVGFVQAREQDVKRVIVSTGTRNHPAVALYLKLGFRVLGDVEIVPGLWITRFEKILG